MASVSGSMVILSVSMADCCGIKRRTISTTKQQKRSDHTRPASHLQTQEEVLTHFTTTTPTDRKRQTKKIPHKDTEQCNTFTQNTDRNDTFSGMKSMRRSRSSSCNFREMPRTGPRWMRFIKCCTTKTRDIPNPPTNMKTNRWPNNKQTNVHTPAGP
jgi:hypothetical protein